MLVTEKLHPPHSLRLGELRRGDSLAPRQTSRLAFCFPFYAYGYGNSGLRAAAKILTGVAMGATSTVLLPAAAE